MTRTAVSVVVPASVGWELCCTQARAELRLRRRRCGARRGGAVWLDSPCGRRRPTAVAVSVLLVGGYCANGRPKDNVCVMGCRRREPAYIAAAGGAGGVEVDVQVESTPPALPPAATAATAAASAFPAAAIATTTITLTHCRSIGHPDPPVL